MNTWQTFSHDRVKNILDRQLDSGIFAQAYAFVGPAQIGKRTLAEEFIKKILETEQITAHPDYIFTDARSAGSVRDVRSVIERLSVRPFSNQGRTVALIDNAESLTPEAMNALLKTLEEPQEHAMILLVAAGPLLPTILSRCCTFSCASATLAQLREYARANDLAIDPGTELLASGAIGRLTELSQDVEQAKQLASIIGQLSKVLRDTRARKLLAVGSFAEHESEQLEHWLTILLAKEKFLIQPKQARSLMEAVDQLRKTVNKKHALAHAFGAYE